MPLRSDGAALRRLRELKGFTIVEFAQRAGYSTHHVSQVELGHENAGLRYLRKAAEVLGCEIADITNGTISRARHRRTSGTSADAPETEKPQGTEAGAA